jgi:hypothetical protein
MSDEIYVIWVRNQTDDNRLYGAFNHESEARRYADAYLKSLPEPTEQLNTLSDRSEPVLTPLMGFEDAWRTDDGLIEVNLVSLNLLDSCDQIEMDFNLQQYDDEWVMAKELSQKGSLRTAKEEIADDAGVETDSWEIEDAEAVQGKMSVLERDDKIAVIDSIKPVMELYDFYEADFTVNNHEELEYHVTEDVLLVIENWSKNSVETNKKELGRALLLPQHD